LPFALSVPQMASKSHSASILRRTQFFSPYFFLNFSTRPAESKSFCFPVKKGWQLEQISTWILPTVERVSTTHPQAHVIVAFLYSGWIPAFMISSLVPEFYNIRKIALQSVLRPRNHRKHVVFSQSGTRPAHPLQGGCLLLICLSAEKPLNYAHEIARLPVWIAFEWFRPSISVKKS